MICALPFLILTPLLPGVQPTAEDIMCRVAENQDRAEKAREAYVYDMNLFVRLKRANGKLAREESRDYVVAPSAAISGSPLQRWPGVVDQIHEIGLEPHAGLGRALGSVWPATHFVEARLRRIGNAVRLSRWLDPEIGIDARVRARRADAPKTRAVHVAPATPIGADVPLPLREVSMM